MSLDADARVQVRQVFQTHLGLTAHEAHDMEVGIYNAMIDYASQHNIPLSWSSELFSQGYLEKARSIYANLHKDSYIGNQRLMERLRAGEFRPHELATMTHDRLYPEHWADIIHQEMLRTKEAYEIKEVPMTSAITCGKCKGKKITYMELQTRSGDEAMTTYYRCITCGNKWKH